MTDSATFEKTNKQVNTATSITCISSVRSLVRDVFNSLAVTLSPAQHRIANPVYHVNHPFCDLHNMMDFATTDTANRLHSHWGDIGFVLTGLISGSFTLR